MSDQVHLPKIDAQLVDNVLPGRSEPQVAWLVRVTFVEPTFDESLNRPTALRFWTWEGLAATSVAASSMAVCEFRRLWIVSSVGWIRKILEVGVEPLH